MIARPVTPEQWAEIEALQQDAPVRLGSVRAADVNDPTQPDPSGTLLLAEDCWATVLPEAPLAILGRALPWLRELPQVYREPWLPPGGP